MPSVTAAAVAGDTLARRRLLLRGLGKGSAVVAALVPIQSIAAIQFGPQLCTVSGIQSNVGSGRTGGTTVNCQGFNPSHFLILSNWPGYVQGNGNSPGSASFLVGATTRTNSSRFDAVFGSGSNTQLDNLFIGNNPSAQTLSERVWAAALLSAVKKLAAGLGPTASATLGYFPYTPTEVIDLYNSNRKIEAEAFFKGYVSQVA